VGCNDDSCVYTHAVFSLPECTCGLSLDSLHGPRADLLRVDGPPKHEIKCIKKDLICKRRDFILTWSKQMVVSSTEAPGINSFHKGVVLAFSQFLN
jgi:hypothetical protein